MRTFPALALAFALLTSSPLTADEIAMSGVLYKNPSCGCCAHWGEYMRENGFEVEIVNSDDLSAIKQEYGIPLEYEGCHTFVIGGYAIEGHVPVGAVLKLLEEQPANISAIALPGMPSGSPGMGGDKDGEFTVYAIGQSAPTVYYAE
jgi:hypothetical protein